MTLTVGSLFAGIGGFDLGFERCGMQTLWQVEQNEFCREVLAHHFPDAKRFVDVREVGIANLPRVDLICGGFPCQDISLAGKGAGIGGERSGLWGEMWRIIRELGPRWVVVENVPALTSRGLDRVLRDLASGGYDAEWDCIPASALGAPHRRDRIWLVAYPAGEGLEGLGAEPGQPQITESRDGCTLADAPRYAKAGTAPSAGAKRERVGAGGQRSGAPGVADADGFEKPQEPQGDGSEQGKRAQVGRGEQQPTGTGAGGRNGGGTDSGRVGGSDPRGRGTGDSGTMADPECSRRHGWPDQQRRDDSIGQTAVGGEGAEDAPRRDPRGRSEPQRLPASEGWGAEPDVGRVADGVPARVDRLSALGNALVPQIAEWIGRRILDYEGGPR